MRGNFQLSLLQIYFQQTAPGQSYNLFMPLCFMNCLRYLLPVISSIFDFIMFQILKSIEYILLMLLHKIEIAKKFLPGDIDDPFMNRVA